MSESHFNTSLIYKIRQERFKRQEYPLNKTHQQIENENKLSFYIDYQEYSKNHHQHSENNTVDIKRNRKRRLRDGYFPLARKMEEKNKQLKDVLPKKISVNFQMFNPRKKIKQQMKETNRILNFQDIVLQSKEKYFLKIDKNNRIKNQRCRMLSTFGLNIKSMEFSDQSQKYSKKAQLKTKETINKQDSNSRIEISTSEIISKQSKQNSSYKKRTIRSKEKSKSFIIEPINKSEISSIKIKMQKMKISHAKLLQSFGCFINNKQIQKQARLKYYVGPGNNKNLIISIFKKRWWWTQVNDPNVANLIWTQLKHQVTLDRIQSCDTNESSLTEYNNAKTQEKQQKISYKSFHFKSFLSLEKSKYKIQQDICNIKEKHSLKKLQIPYCGHNHFSHNFMFGNKKALFQNLTSYFNYKRQDVFSIIPLTFLAENKDQSKFQDFEKKISIYKHYIWIVKPGQNSNRGNGIFVTKSLEEIKTRMNCKKTKQTFIIQRYLTNIFLYQKRKFDIRTYLLMLSIGGVTKFFWYNEGYIRTSSEVFDVKNLTDSFIHLTNDAVQIKNDSYGKFQDGNKLSYNQFQHYLDYNYPSQKYSMKELNQKMKQITIEAVRSTSHKLDPQQKNYSFQVFGLDFMVDSLFKPWLIEINTNPCLELTSPVLHRIIPRMIENVFRIAIDPIYQPLQDINHSKHYYIYQNCLQKNYFSLIFDSRVDRDFKWQQYSKNVESKQYEEDNITFQNDGVQISINN